MDVHLVRLFGAKNFSLLDIFCLNQDCQDLRIFRMWANYPAGACYAEYPNNDALTGVPSLTGNCAAQLL